MSRLVKESLNRWHNFQNTNQPATMGRGITESVVAHAALDWLGGLRHEPLSGLIIAPGKPPAERADYKQVFLLDRLSGELRVPDATIAKDHA